jgi:hypothetical protein
MKMKMHGGGGYSGEVIYTDSSFALLVPTQGGLFQPSTWEFSIESTTLCIGCYSVYHKHTYLSIYTCNPASLNVLGTRYFDAIAIFSGISYPNTQHNHMLSLSGGE